jgi:penicillin-binding protein 1A
MTAVLKVIKWGFLLGLLCAAVGAATLAGMFWVYGSDPNLPHITRLKDYKPKQTTRILAADGKVVGELYVERRTFVPIEKIAPIMLQATIDAEDADFRSHSGISVVGMLRALWVDLRTGRSRQGASTITQQVVKTFLLSPEKTVKRKLQEILLARRLEQALTKDEILTLYLNQIYFGHGRYGVEEAARFYFGKSAAELDAGEAAMLAGLPQSPERLSPWKHPEAAKARQTYVLDQMAKHGHLPEAEAQRLIDAPIRIVKNGEPYLDVAPEWVDIIKRELEKRFGPDVATLGLTVQTTLDVGLEQAARAALEQGLRDLDERHGYRGPIARLKPAEVAAKLKALARTQADPRPGETYDAIVTQVTDTTLGVDLGGWQGTVELALTEDRINPQHRKAGERFAAGDLVRVRLAPEVAAAAGLRPGGDTERSAHTCVLELGPQAAMVAIDPTNRHVLAVVGGYDFQIGGFDRAVRAKRQPGSSFKPYLYAAALDSGLFTPASILNDAPEVYDLWKPKNYEHEGFRGPVRLRDALAHSINTVAIRLMHEVTPPKVIELARGLGVDEELPAEMSLALGSGVVTPLEHVNAYATFAAGGQYAPPVFIVAINDEADKPAEPRQALRPEIAFLTTSMMESVVEEGTATAARKLRRELSGKTGTSNSGKDAWFVGFTPDLVAGAWVGFDDMRTIGRGETGAKAALPIWIDFMKVALKARAARSFVQPSGVVVARIDRRTGLLAAPGEAEADTLNEVFLEGTVPTETAPAPGEVDPSTFMLEQTGVDDEQGAANAPPDTQ